MLSTPRVDNSLAVRFSAIVAFAVDPGKAMAAARGFPSGTKSAASGFKGFASRPADYRSSFSFPDICGQDRIPDLSSKL